MNAPQTNETDIAANLAQWLSQRIGEEVETDVGMYDAGYLDSLSAADFVVYIEEHYGQTLEQLDLVTEYETIAHLARWISSQAVP